MTAQLAKTGPDRMEESTHQTNSTTYNYYLLRKGSEEFKVIYMSVADASLWAAAGWEISCHNSNEEARVALGGWEKRSLAGSKGTGIHVA